MEGPASSPAQRMFGCHTQTLIPTTNELLKPKIVEDVPEKLLKRKQGQAKYYNISAKELPHLSSVDVVRVKPIDRSGRWYKARVDQQVDVRSYDVITNDGPVFRRNRRHLQRKEPLCASTNLMADSLPGVAPSNLVPPASPISGESSTSQEVQQPPTDATESDKVNSTARPEEIPVSTKPVKSTVLPVTPSGHVSRPPSQLKDFFAMK